jgi:putative ABC transport system substrate-binding protein
MRRRDFIKVVAVSTTWPLAAHAQQQPMSVIGLLAGTNPNLYQLEAVRKGLNENGYFEGRNLAIIYRSADSQLEQLPRLATELVDAKVSVILTIGPPAARVAKTVTRIIPVVFAYGGDPVADGLVDSINRPGGNVTGVTFFAATLTAKKFDLLREIVPQAIDIGLLVNPTGALAKMEIKEMSEATQKLGQHLHIANVSNEDEINTAMAAMSQQNVGALVIGTNPIFGIYRDQLVALMARYKIPAIHNGREYCEAGGLMSYGASLTEAFRQASIYVARILKGDTNLPVMLPTKFELVINLKTAKTLGISIPQSLLTSADEVIE